MKNKLFAVAIILMIAVMGLLTSCGCKHEAVVDPKVDATCTETGLTEGSHCSLCNEVLTAQETIPATGHTETVLEAKEATCTEDGLTEGKSCTVCNETLVAQEVIPAKGHTEEITLPGKEATCTETGLTDEIKCTTCNSVIEEQKTVSALGHTTTSGTCTRCDSVIGVWTSTYYVDEFDMPTDRAYIYNETYFVGTFSNSATTDSKLNVLLLVDKEDISVFLYEYGRNLVKNNSSRNTDWYTVTIRMADGSKLEYEAAINPGGDRMFFKSADYASVVNALKSGEKIAIYIVDQQYPTTNYLFQIETSNFAEVFKVFE